jgi:hypothetical protein
MKESMTKNQVSVGNQMNKLAIIPIFFLTMCGTAPVIDPPAHACSPRLDGKPTYCPPPDGGPMFPKPKPNIKKEYVKGEIDITSPYHLQSLQMMFIRNARRTQIEENATPPSDAINSALDDFMEAQYGSNGSTKQEKLL